ncbi:hypothetical protein [Priestia megaterium]|uniref:hypothetical protein n=1 Tax=Priestia megaterium TaxID=1404 RepID=UPI0004BAAD8C|nr:hypothetical protein [Priestia megaterium]
MKTPAGKAESGETPQERKRRGGSAVARGKRSHAWQSTACHKQSILVPLFNLLIFRWVELLMSQSLF